MQNSKEVSQIIAGIAEITTELILDFLDSTINRAARNMGLLGFGSLRSKLDRQMLKMRENPEFESRLNELQADNYERLRSG